MKNLTRAETAGFLLSHDNFCILTHRRPDGDTIGSAAALCLGLRQLGKTAYVLENPEVTERYAFLLEGLTRSEAGKNDTVVAVDVAAASLLPAAFASFQDKVQLSIDHHTSANPYAAEQLVDGNSASCAELVCDVLTLLGIQLDKEIGTAVYVGTSTDTGCFRYANTTAHSFMIAAICAQAGVEVYKLNQRLFETKSLAKLRLQAWMIQNLQVFGDGKFAVVAIPRELELELGVTEDDIDNISAYPRSVEGVCMAATLRQTEDGRTKISVRAVPGYDAAAVCAHFGGGGHTAAGGATTDLSLEEVAAQIKEAMLEQV